MYNDVECPYCGFEFDLNHDDGQYYNESRAEDCECPDCGKNFLVASTMSWSHEGIKADCLNDGKHQWKKRWTHYMIEAHPKLAADEECETCETRRTIQIEESK